MAFYAGRNRPRAGDGESHRRRADRPQRPSTTQLFATFARCARPAAPASRAGREPGGSARPARGGNRAAWCSPPSRSSSPRRRDDRPPAARMETRRFPRPPAAAPAGRIVRDSGQRNRQTTRHAPAVAALARRKRRGDRRRGPIAASTTSSTATPATCADAPAQRLVHRLQPVPRSSSKTPAPRAVFGDHISVYDVRRAVEDGATVPIYYESRLARLALDEHERAEHRPPASRRATEGEEIDPPRKAEDQVGRSSKPSSGASKRVALVARDVVDHFEKAPGGHARQGDDRVHEPAASASTSTASSCACARSGTGDGRRPRARARW